MDRKKVGLALSGGGARGLAHIGVLKVLEENNIPIDVISGTSMGAFIGAFYASRKNIKVVEEEILSIGWKNIFDYTIPTKGLIRGDKIESILTQKLGRLKFNDLKIPLLVTSYDIRNDQEVVFTKGDLIKSIRASISIPGIFVPVSNKHQILVDGGLVDPVPTEILKDRADIIIAVNVNKIKKRKIVLGETALIERDKDILPSVFECTTKALQVLSSEVSEHDLVGEEISLIIDVDLGDKGVLDFSNPESIIKKGEEAARAMLKKIKSVSKPNSFKNFFMSLQEGLEKNNLGIGNISKTIEKLGN